LIYSILLSPKVAGCGLCFHKGVSALAMYVKDDLCQVTNLGREGRVPTNAINEKGLINTIHAE
jgi:hypothetical protein